MAPSKNPRRGNDPLRNLPSEKEELALRLLLDLGETYGLDLVTRSDGGLKRGTVYVTLGRLEDEGLITSRKEERPGIDPALARRLYRVTSQGETALRTLDRIRGVLAGGVAT